MRELLPITTTREEMDRAAPIAVLPVGSHEQHGDFLPLATDTIIACALAQEVADAYELRLLPPITISCSHEHVGWRGTVSISARTLAGVIMDIAESLCGDGVERLLLVNAHGGNYVLSNVVQEASVARPSLALFPSQDAWQDARQSAGMMTDHHADMHAGELETSILLHVAPEVVRPGFESADHDANERQLLGTAGMRGYTSSGVIGRPSLASAEKGEALLVALTHLAQPYIDALR